MKKLKQALLFTFTLLFVLVGCGANNEDVATETTTTPTGEVTADTDTLVIGMSNAPSSQNPFFAQGTSAFWTMRFFYESLLDQISATEFVPRLGEFSTEDNLNFTVSLNPDAQWTDGEPVTAKDVAFTINTIAHPDTLTSVGVKIAMLEGTDDAGKMLDGLEELSGVEIIDDHTLNLTTKMPVDINYISEFLGLGILITPEHVFGDIPKDELHNTEAVTQPTVFNGAYEFVEYEEENYLHLKANENYYRGAPKINEIFFRVLSNQAMVTELQSGGIHMVSQGGFGDIPHSDIDLVKQVENLVVEEYPSPNVQYLISNSSSPRLEDKRVRQAFGYAIDFDSTIENLLLGHGESLAASYSSANNYKDESLEPYPYDPDKAVELLNESGFDFSQPLRLGVPTGNTIREQNADLIQQSLEDIGIEIVQTQYDFTTWLSFLRDGDFDIGLWGQAHTYDPDLSNVFATTGSSNYGKYSSEEMDTLLKQGTDEVDVDKRYAIYQKVQQLVKEDAANIPLYSESVYSVQVDNLKGGVKAFYPATLTDVHEWELTETN